MHNQLRGGRYLAEERGAFERVTLDVPISNPAQDKPKDFRLPLINFLEQRSRSFFAWAAEHGWSELRHA